MGTMQAQSFSRNGRQIQGLPWSLDFCEAYDEKTFSFTAFALFHISPTQIGQGSYAGLEDKEKRRSPVEWASSQM